MEEVIFVFKFSKVNIESIFIIFLFNILFRFFILSFLFKGGLPSNNPNEIREDRQARRKEKYNTSKEEVLNSDELANRNRQIGSNVSSKQNIIETVVRENRKIGRNERVKIKNIQTGEVKEIKYKQAEPLISKGNWNIIEN